MLPVIQFSIVCPVALSATVPLTSLVGDVGGLIEKYDWYLGVVFLNEKEVFFFYPGMHLLVKYRSGCLQKLLENLTKYFGEGSSI